MKPPTDREYEFSGIPSPGSTLIREIRNIVTRCNQNDGSHFGWEDSDEFQNEGETAVFVARRDNRIVGWLQIFAPHAEEGELICQVLPEHRRQGIFTQLLKMACSELEKRGLKRALLVTEAGIIGERDFAKKTKSAYRFSEFLLRYQSGLTPLPADSDLDSNRTVILAEAMPEDRNALAAINEEAFPGAASVYGGMIDEFFRSNRRHNYRIENAGKLVGMIGIYDGSPEAYIHAFAVSESERGQGIGKQALSAAVQMILKEQPGRRIELEVETNNRKALNLYQSVGFKLISEFRYYQIVLK